MTWNDLEFQCHQGPTPCPVTVATAELGNDPFRLLDKYNQDICHAKVEATEMIRNCVKVVGSKATGLACTNKFSIKVGI